MKSDTVPRHQRSRRRGGRSGAPPRPRARLHPDRLVAGGRWPTTSRPTTGWCWSTFPVTAAPPSGRRPHDRCRSVGPGWRARLLPRLLDGCPFLPPRWPWPIRRRSTRWSSSRAPRASTIRSSAAPAVWPTTSWPTSSLRRRAALPRSASSASSASGWHNRCSPASTERAARSTSALRNTAAGLASSLRLAGHRHPATPLGPSR